MNISLHSLVFLQNNINLQWPYNHEVINFNNIEYNIYGSYHKDHYDNVIKEICHVVAFKISIGERCVIVFDTLKLRDKLNIINVISKYNINIYYIVDCNTLHFDIPNDVQIVNCASFNILEKYNLNNNLSLNKINYYCGITVVGDVHGNYTSLCDAITWANNKHNLLIFLGDIIDYGYENLSCIKKIYSLVINNNAILIRGNHERKIFRYLQSYNKSTINLSEGNKTTIAEFDKLDYANKIIYETMFKTLYNLSINYIKVDNVIFSHAAVNNDMVQCKTSYSIDNFAMYGEYDTGQKFKQNHSWVDMLPNGITAVVGHEILSIIAPVNKLGKNGGSATFIDLGSSKNGNLCSADFSITKNTLKLTNFNIY